MTPRSRSSTRTATRCRPASSATSTCGGRDGAYDYRGGAALLPMTADGFGTAGDIGRVDADGFLYLVDRRADMIITGGANVFPAEVESALADHPASPTSSSSGSRTSSGAAGCTPSSRRRTRRRRSTEADVIAYAKSRLAAYKVPKTVEFVDAIPRSAATKVSRAAMTEARRRRLDWQSPLAEVPFSFHVLVSTCGTCICQYQGRYGRSHHGCQDARPQEQEPAEASLARPGGRAVAARCARKGHVPVGPIHRGRHRDPERDRPHRLHGAGADRALADLAAFLLPALQWQGRAAARAVRGDHLGLGHGVAGRDRRATGHPRRRCVCCSTGSTARRPRRRAAASTGRCRSTTCNSPSRGRRTTRGCSRRCAS